MALLNQALQVSSQLKKFFTALQGGQAPSKVNRQFLKDIGFSSSNHLAFVPLLKGLGFLTVDGIPTSRYREMLDSTRFNSVLAEAIREAYSDIFVLKSKPTKSDKPMIMGKYKTTYNMSETTADRAAQTFLHLIEIAGESALYNNLPENAKPGADAESHGKPRDNAEEKQVKVPPIVSSIKPAASIHYNIQIHLPATKDIEVYNSIFRSLKEHIID